AVAALPTAARATTEAAATNAADHAVGDFTVTTLLAGTGEQGEPQGTFGMNVDAETFSEVSAANFISAETYQGYFTPVLVRAGEDVILFDTGMNPEGIVGALADADTAPEDVTHVVLTHMHPDHIGGLLTDGAPTFDNAAYVTGRTEYDFWTSGPGAESGLGGMIAGAVGPLAERMTFLEPGQDVRGGITAVEAFGHTPGHMTYMVESNGTQMLLAADLANHYVWSLAKPDWEVRFDADKAAAAASRRRILGMLAADRVAMSGYHLPFPGVGFVEEDGDGFRWTPATYQFT
ncbi:MAG: MBL fold metallo-hydrolase, partial [Shimia sp.]